MKFFRIIREKIKGYFSLKSILEQANLFKVISENTDDVIWVYDFSKEKFTYVSPSVEKLRGYSSHEVLNQSLTDRLTPDMQKYVNENLNKRIALIEAGDHSLKVSKDRVFQLHKSGKVIPSEVISNFIVNDKGKVIQLIGITRNISENVESEEKLKQAYSELSERYNELESVKEKLKISRDFIKNVFDSVNDAILIYDVRTKRLVDVNQRMCYLFCYSYEEAVRLRIEDISFDSESYSKNEVDSVLQKAMDEGIQTLDWRFRKKNGDAFWGNVSIRFIQIGDEDFFVATIRDITEQKNATYALRKSRNQLQAVLDTSLDAITLTNPEGIFLACNNTLLKRWNKSKAEMLNHSASEFLPPDIFSDRIQKIEKCITTKSELYFIDSYNGHFFENTISPIIEANGNVDTVALFSRDITERKKAVQNLEESEARYRFLFENNPLPMLIYERNTYKMLAVNEAFTIHYGYSKDEIQNFLLTDLYPEHEKEKIMNVAGKLKGHVNVGEWHHIKKDGTIITIIAQSHDLDYMGKSSRVAVLTDITEQKFVEMEILKLNKELELRVMQRTSQLETAYKDMESFSYSVSHDLRAPLRAITGFSEIIARRYRTELNSEVQHYLDNIIKASNRMGNLIDDLLVYSRLGRQGVTLVPISLNQIMESVINDFSISLKDNNGTIEIQKNLPVVNGDKSLLHQVFTNLFENALKYRKPEIQVVIKVWALNDDDKVKIFVGDNGIGIAPEHHKRIFNIFQRLHGDDKYPGTGIGLSTVKKSLELLCGNIFVESESGKGSTFIIELQKGKI